MNEEKCILCGRAFPLGLNIMGCLICFSCEKRLLNVEIHTKRRRRLCRLYAPFKPYTGTSAK